MMILIITMSDDQVSKHKWLLHATVMQAGKLSELRRQDKQVIDLLTIITKPEEFHS
jgi:hypothetical protein